MSAHYDIAVIGSGAAGIAAAVSAARTGHSTLLLDKNPAVGGIGGFSGLTTLCGLYDDQGNFLNAGFSHEFSDSLAEAPPLIMGRVWVLPYRPEKFLAIAQNFISAEPKLKSVWNSPLADVDIQDHRIVSLNGFSVGAVIDCTGDAEVARAAGAECLATDDSTQAPAVIFPLQNVTREFLTPADAAQVLLPLARAGIPLVNFKPDLAGSLTVKFTGTPEQVPALIDFLRTNVPGFEKCSTPLTTLSTTRRAGRMIIGEHILTGAEVLSGTKFPDAVARCAWPIEQWSAAGQTRLRYLPPGTHYEIPARSLRAATIKNLFMAGKTISADVDAIASARVMGCCLATGEAAGKLAANYLDSARSE
ncbi:MAG TPA: FAD-dependent oxidoreductase [Verrucomicrobiae bacterium]|nr:FAD-dependent oxidoreductase [Verrucomicrobiae bacterium]